MLEAESSNDRDGLPSLVRHLNSNSWLYPYSRRHPEVERRFINVDNVCVGFRHYYSSDRGAELLLLVAELLSPLILGLVDHLWLSIAGSMFKVDLSNEPRGQLC